MENQGQSPYEGNQGGNQAPLFRNLRHKEGTFGSREHETVAPARRGSQQAAVRARLSADS
jgi:hypothetical protein